MIIRSDQYRQLETSQEHAFEERVESYLRTNFSSHPSECESREEIRRQIRSARRYGLVSEKEIVIYVIMAWLFGTDFDRTLPPASAVLRDPSLGPSGKANALEEIAYSTATPTDSKEGV